MWRAVQIYKKQEHRTSFKSSGVAQWYAVVARSRSASKTFSDQFWNLLFWREAQVQVKMYKTHRFVRAMFGSSVEKLVVLVVREGRVRTIFGSPDVETVRLLWRETHFPVKMSENMGFGRLLEG